MPLLAAWLTTLAAWLVENVFAGLAIWFTKLTIARIAYSAMVLSAILFMFATVKAAILAFDHAVPGWFGVASTWVFPSNLPYVITFYLTVRAAGALFRYTRQIIWGAAGGSQPGMGSLGN